MRAGVDDSLNVRIRMQLEVGDAGGERKIRCLISAMGSAGSRGAEEGRTPDANWRHSSTLHLGKLNVPEVQREGRHTL